jgi:hypothetical protein
VPRVWGGSGGWERETKSWHERSTGLNEIQENVAITIGGFGKVGLMDRNDGRAGTGTQQDIMFNAKDVVQLALLRCCFINACAARVSFAVRVRRLRTGM